MFLSHWFVLVLFYTWLSFCGCSSTTDPTYYWRPALHFTPTINWMNDPNGLVYDPTTGFWHLFMQYNPYGIEWGSMSWGHSVSTDLFQWNHLPVAMTPSGGVSVFSGSAVLDRNTSGLCGQYVPCLICIFAGNNDSSGRENINLGYSIDAQKQVYVKFTGNPVIDIGSNNFRDPSVFWWNTDSGGGWWVAVVAHSDLSRVDIYNSSDLIHWQLMSSFGPAGAGNGWECPDLFPLNLDSSPGTAFWVLTVSVESTTGVYFVGKFNGSHFTVSSDAQTAKPMSLDLGQDFYAAITYNNAPNNRRVLFGWMVRSAYARTQHTDIHTLLKSCFYSRV